MPSSLSCRKASRSWVPKGVKANMVEEQLKGLTPDPEKATMSRKAQAEETVRRIGDQMVLDALAEKLDVQVSQSDVFNFLASIAQQYGAWTRTTSSRPSSEWPAWLPLCRKSAVPGACSPACAPSSSPLMARLGPSGFLGEAVRGRRVRVRRGRFRCCRRGR